METILLVDDSKAVTYIVSKFLEKEGYDVKIAHEARTGLKMAKEGKVDLIISDIMMPGIDGYELAGTLKEDPVTKNIPLIYFTAKGDLSDEFHGYMQGAEYYITKPVKKAELLDKIEKCLGKRSKTQMLEVNRHAAPPQSGSSKGLIVPEFKPKFTEEVEGEIDQALTAEVVHIYGSMLEVMWAFSFDKLLSLDNINLIEKVIDATSKEYPFIQYLDFSEDGIELDRFKENTENETLKSINRGFSSLIYNFFEVLAREGNMGNGG